MSEKLSIKINIANRLYPMKVNKESEEHIRLAAKNIEERIKSVSYTHLTLPTTPYV